MLIVAVLLLSLAGAVDETVETIFVLHAAHNDAAVSMILLAVMGGGLLAGPASTRVIHSAWMARRPHLFVAGLLGVEGVAIIASGLWRSAWSMWLVAGILGFAGTLFWSIFLAILPDLIPEEQLLRVNKWISFARNSGFALGPFVGSMLYSAFGVSVLSFIGIVTAALALLCFVGVGRFTGAASAEPETEESTTRASVVAGIRRLLVSPIQAELLVAVSLVVLLMALANVLSVSHITITRGFGDQVFGLYNGSISIGLVLGPILLVERLRRFPERHVVVAALMVWALAVVAFSVATSVWQVLLIGLVIGLMNGTMVPFYVSQLMSLSKKVPEGKSLLPAYVFCANVVTALGYLITMILPSLPSTLILLVSGIIAASLVLLCWLSVIIRHRRTSCAGAHSGCSYRGRIAHTD